jgi:hypothetical protein
VQISSAAANSNREQNVRNDLATQQVQKSAEATATKGVEVAQRVSQSSGLGQRVDLYA